MTLDEQAFVTWTHPSMRDVVIDYLASNDRERLEFISTMGLRGISLSVSVGGGAAGDRSFPLLVTTADWDAFAERVSQIVEEIPANDVGGLLSPLIEAFGNVSNDPIRRAHLRRTARVALEAVRDRWSSADSVPSLRQLRQFYGLADQLDEFVAGPFLGGIWAEIYERAEEEEEEARGCRDVHYPTLSAAMALADLYSVIQLNEPRFLRVADRAAATLRLISLALDDVYELVQGLQDLSPEETMAVTYEDEDGEFHSVEEPVEPEWIESDELAFCEEVEAFLEEVRTALPELAPDDLLEQVSGHASTRDERRERRSQWEADHRDWDMEPEPSSGDSFDLADFFSDLQ